MLIDWLICVVYLGILLSWNPAFWSVGLLQAGVLALSAIVVGRDTLRRVSFRPQIDTVLFAAIVAWGPLQALLHQTVNPLQTWNTALGWLTTASVYFLARTLLRDRATRQRFLVITLWIGVGIAIVSTLFLFNSPGRVFGLFESRYPPFGPFVYKNHFAVFVEILIPIAFYRMVSGGKAWAGYGVVLAALLASIVASLSRGGMLVAGAELVVLAFMSWQQRKVSGAVLLKVGLPLVALMVVFSAIVGWGGMLSRFREAHPFEHRTELVQSSWEMIKQRPALGYGLGTWRIVYPQFATFDIVRIANEAHNDWIQWGAEGGVVFFLLVLALVVWISRFSWRHLWGIGFPAVFVHALVDFPTRSPALAAFLFLIGGALTSTYMEKRWKREVAKGPEWRVLSVRTAAE